MTKPTADSDDVAYFGYGSLVNELTWTCHFDMQPAEIRNWAREWKHCIDSPFGARHICALTVTHAPESRVRGVFIRCNLAELEHVDKREIGYERIEISPADVISFGNELPPRLFLYTSSAACYRDGDINYPLWMSYIECVLYGYLRVFGEAGVEDFIRYTTGWSTPAIDDRTRPLYPRAVELPPEQRRMLDNRIRQIAGLTLAQA